jgi:hypothetical protein
VLTAAALLAPAGSTLAQSSKATVTFARDVAPIFQAKCQGCHRPGQMAPMSLLTYDEARPWARSIKTKVAARDMPPWHLDKTVGIQKFANDKSLTDTQIATVVAWVDAGAPLGDPKDLPPARQWPNDEQWRLASSQGRSPDFIIKSTPWTQPADGQDQWWQLVVEAITDQVEVGVWFYPKGYLPKYQVKSSAMGVFQSMDEFDLPPGRVTVHHAYIRLSEPTKILSYQPHMHVRGKAMSMEAIYPDGRVEMLNYVDHFNFNWHVNYVYADEAAPLLPKGTVIHLTAWHDNAAANKNNPDPTQWVGWGQRSFDDMYHAHVRLINLSDEDFQRLVEERKKAAAATTTGAQQ